MDEITKNSVLFKEDIDRKILFYNFSKHKDDRHALPLNSFKKKKIIFIFEAKC